MKRVGFWRSSKSPLLPMPQERVRPAAGTANFLAALSVLELSLINDHRANVSRYDEQFAPDVHEYREASTCRICGAPNGNKEFVFGGLQGFIWPSGYKHYLDAHHVEPDREFQQFIRAWAYRFVTIDGQPWII